MKRIKRLRKRTVRINQTVYKSAKFIQNIPNLLHGRNFSSSNHILIRILVGQKFKYMRYCYKPVKWVSIHTKMDLHYRFHVWKHCSVHNVPRHTLDVIISMSICEWNTVWRKQIDAGGLSAHFVVGKCIAGQQLHYSVTVKGSTRKTLVRTVHQLLIITCMVLLAQTTFYRKHQNSVVRYYTCTIYSITKFVYSSREYKRTSLYQTYK